MSRDALRLRPLQALLEAGRGLAVAVALVALLGLTAVPHHHEGAAEERACPACQVSRADGAGVPGTISAVLVPPAGVVLLSHVVAPDPAAAPVHAAPLPSRGPPPVFPSEPL